MNSSDDFIVTAGEKSKRLDLFLANRQPLYSRSAIQRLIKEGLVRINGQVMRASYKIKPGDRISLEIERPQPLDLKAEAICLTVLYEDEEVLVLDKPAGLVVHPAPGNWTGTLVNALLHHFGTSGSTISTVGGKERPGLVHRLDKETSGVMVVAKTDRAHRGLAVQFKDHTISRVYEALVWGVPKKGRGRIELAIGRDTRERKKFSVRTTKPKASVTEYEVDRRFGKTAAHVLLHPQTGRTHQLRVHLNAMGHSVLGDHTYGGDRVCDIGEQHFARVMLHARTLGFSHPGSGVFQEFVVPAPVDFAAAFAALESMTASARDLDRGGEVASQSVRVRR